jgi:uncharacterized spore protein YtfJ
VYGDPYEHEGLTVIPAARVRGGGGGGSGSGTRADGEGSGSGGGFGLTASPAGAFVIRGDHATWRPAVNVERIVLASLTFAAIVVLALRPLIGHCSKGGAA